MESETAPIICPACGGSNEHNAVFCANAKCHKALGEFDYVVEELRQEAKWHESIAERFTAWIAQPQFLTAHIVWFVLWILINTGIVALVHRFDAAPFSMLAFIISIETVFITIFVIITQSRQNAFDRKRAELDYEVNVLTYRTIKRIDSALESMDRRLTAIEQKDDSK